MRRLQQLLAFCAACSFLMATYCVLNSSLLPKMQKMGEKEASLLNEIAVLQQQITKKSDEIKLMTGNSSESLAFLESVARNELFFIGKDEVLLTLY